MSLEPTEKTHECFYLFELISEKDEIRSNHLTSVHGYFKIPAVVKEAYTADTDLLDFHSFNKRSLAGFHSVDHGPPFRRVFIPDNHCNFERRRGYGSSARRRFGNCFSRSGNDTRRCPRCLNRSRAGLLLNRSLDFCRGRACFRLSSRRGRSCRCGCNRQYPGNPWAINDTGR